MPFLKILAIAQVALMVRRHLRGLTRDERRRLAELARKGTSLSPAERVELRALVSKFETKTLLVNATDRLSPFPLPRWLLAKLR
jgi:hypothetical protein